MAVIDKPANMIVHPGRGRDNWHGTLVNGLAYYGSKWSNVNGAWRPGILHRLDRNTTGTDVAFRKRSHEGTVPLARFRTGEVLMAGLGRYGLAPFHDGSEVA